MGGWVVEKEKKWVGGWRKRCLKPPTLIYTQPTHPPTLTQPQRAAILRRVFPSKRVCRCSTIEGEEEEEEEEEEEGGGGGGGEERGRGGWEERAETDAGLGLEVSGWVGGWVGWMDA